MESNNAVRFSTFRNLKTVQQLLFKYAKPLST